MLDLWPPKKKLHRNVWNLYLISRALFQSGQLRYPAPLISLSTKFSYFNTHTVLPSSRILPLVPSVQYWRSIYRARVNPFLPFPCLFDPRSSQILNLLVTLAIFSLCLICGISEFELSCSHCTRLQSESQLLLTPPERKPPFGAKAEMRMKAEHCSPDLTYLITSGQNDRFNWASSCYPLTNYAWVNPFST
jgi:hypothetical protein